MAENKDKDNDNTNPEKGKDNGDNNKNGSKQTPNTKKPTPNNTNKNDNGTMMLDDDEEEEEDPNTILQSKLEFNNVFKMYNKEEIYEPVYVQVGGFKKVDNSPVKFVATVQDLNMKMPVLFAFKYSKMIKDKQIKDFDVIEIADWTWGVLAEKQVIVITEMKKIGTLGMLPPAVGIVQRRAPTQTLPKMTTNNAINSNSYNYTPLSYTNLTNPFSGGVTPRHRMQQQTQSSRVQGYNAQLSSNVPRPQSAPRAQNTFTPIFTDFNTETGQFTNNQFDQQLSTMTTAQINQQAAKMHNKMNDIIKSVHGKGQTINQNENSNSNSNDNNSNDNSNSNDNNNNDNNQMQFDSFDYSGMIKDMATGGGVPLQSHPNAPAQRNLPLRKGLSEATLPEIQAAKNMTQDQTDWLLNHIDNQNQQLSNQPSGSSSKMNIQQFLRNQNVSKVAAMS